MPAASSRRIAAHASTSGGRCSSASPRNAASMNGAIGSGCDATGPPTSTSVASAARSHARSGIPPRSSSVSTLVYVSSYWSEMPSTSNSWSGRWRSSETSGSPRARSSASMSSHGANARSHAIRGSLVEHRVDDLRPEMGHPDVVHIRKPEAHARVRLILGDRHVLAAEVSRRLGDAVDEVGVEVAHWNMSGGDTPEEGTRRGHRLEYGACA